MSIQLIVGGTDLTNYVVSAERHNSICKPIGQLALLLEPNLPRTIATYEEVTFYENGTKVFTGYTSEAVKAKMPIEARLNCSDVLVRAKDTWLDTYYVSYGESVAYWVGKFLELSGITNTDIGVGSGRQVYEGFGWQYVTALDAIVQTLQMCPYQIMADRDGKVHLMEMTPSTPTTTISEYLQYERKRNDNWLRNRAVVFGADFAAEKFQANSLLPDEVRTVVVATGAIHNQSTADALASELISCFSVPLDIKIVQIEGNPNLEIGQTVTFTDSWSGYSANCLITSLVSTYDSTGYKIELTLDEKCPNFWGWDRIFPILYCGTWGGGVYKSINYGQDWTYIGPASDTDVHNIAVVEEGTLWIVSSDGLFRTETDGTSWSEITIPAPPGEGASQTPAAVKYYAPTVYVLVYKASPAKSWLAYSDDDGLTWDFIALDSGGLLGYCMEDMWGCNNYEFGHKFVVAEGTTVIPEAAVEEDSEGVRHRNGDDDWVNNNAYWDYPTGGMCDGYIGYSDYWAAGQGIAKYFSGSWTQYRATKQYTDIIKGGAADFTAARANIEWPSFVRVEGILSDGSMINYVNLEPWGWPMHLYTYNDGDDHVLIATDSGYILRWDTPWDDDNEVEYSGDVVTGGFSRLYYGPFSYYYCAATNTNRLLRRESGGNWVYDDAFCPYDIRGVAYYLSDTYVVTESGVYRHNGDSGDPQYIKISNVPFGYRLTGGTVGSRIMSSSGIYRLTAPVAGMLPPTNGRHHIMSMSADGQYMYIALRVDGGTAPRLLRVDLVTDDYTVVKIAASGAWGGIVADYYDAEKVIGFGDFGTEKVLISEDHAQTWNDKTSTDWAANEVVRPVLVDELSIEPDLLAILNTDKECWRSPDYGETWVKKGDIEFSCHCGMRGDVPIKLFIGRLTSGAVHLQYSENSGGAWEERSGGIAANVPVTAIEAVVEL